MDEPIELCLRPTDSLGKFSAFACKQRREQSSLVLQDFPSTIICSLGMRILRPKEFSKTFQSLGNEMFDRTGQYSTLTKRGSRNLLPFGGNLFANCDHNTFPQPSIRTDSSSIERQKWKSKRLSSEFTFVIKSVAGRVYLFLRHLETVDQLIECDAIGSNLVAIHSKFQFRVSRNDDESAQAKRWM
jgi:hypothetical protein